MAASLSLLAAGHIICDQTDTVTPTLEIFESEAVSTEHAVEDQPAQQQYTLELPPPHRFRRQLGKKVSSLDLKAQVQNHNYLVAYRAAIGRMLTEACSTARPYDQAEVQQIARRVYSRP